MNSMLNIPIFPLRTVLYPAGRLPLRIFEVRYVDMTKACIRDGSPFGVCLIRQGNEIGIPATPFETGCTARIAEWEVPHAGLFSLVVEGEQTFRILRQWTEANGLIRAEVQLEAAPAPAPLPDLYRPLAELLREIIDKLGAATFSQPLRLDDAAWVSHRLAEILPLADEQKQHLLETRDPEAMLSGIARFVKTLRAAAE